MMQSQKRQQKTCWSCEGNVSPEALFCPYCGSDVQIRSAISSHHTLVENPTRDASLLSEGTQDRTNLASLYKPPYSPNQRGFGVPNFQEEVSPSDDFYYANSAHQTIYSPEAKEELRPQEEVVQRTEAGLWPLLFLSVGANLLTIGLLLFFFSDRGKLVLEWNSYYWFVYCILATPLLMFGWKLLEPNEPHQE
jgi:predicted RNA-binding Zn-ribbon protein involved in translation (DUF1610 family)